MTNANKNRRNLELAEWVKLYTRELYAWAYRKTSHQQLSEDMVQDTFLSPV